MSQATQTADAEEVIGLLTLHFKPGTAAGVLAQIIPSVRLTRMEPGNNDFHLFRVAGHDDQVIVFERWKSQAALGWHWAQPYTRQTLALFDEYLLEPLSDTRDVRHLTDVMQQGD